MRPTYGFGAVLLDRPAGAHGPAGLVLAGALLLAVGICACVPVLLRRTGWRLVRGMTLAVVVVAALIAGLWGTQHASHGSDLTVGRIVTVREPNGGINTHRVHTVYANGQLAQLKGDANETPDPSTIVQSDVLGAPIVAFTGPFTDPAEWATNRAVRLGAPLLAVVCLLMAPEPRRRQRMRLNWLLGPEAAPTPAKLYKREMGHKPPRKLRRAADSSVSGLTEEIVEVGSTSRVGKELQPT
jgi:hypothetical protein